MKNHIFQNWILKLLSVVCAIVLWTSIYNVNDLAESKRLYNVPVTFINTQVITDKGQVYEVLDNTDVLKYITISSTRSVINDLKDSDINVEADFSKMKLDGTIELKIYSDRHNDDITFKPSKEEVKLLIENKVDKYLALEMQCVGEPAAGYIVGSSKLAQNRITVSGAESVIESIDKAVAMVDVTDISGDIFSFADITLYDEAGQEISKDKIEMTAKTVSATVEIWATKTVPIRYEAEGTVAEGNVATGEIISETNELLIAGKESILSSVTEIVVSGEEMYYEDADEDVKKVIDIDKYLPAGVSRASKQGNGYVSVTILIAPVVDKEYTLPMGQITLENVPQGYSMKHVLDSAEFVVTLHGSQYLLNALRSDDIQGKIDIADWMETEGIRRLEDGMVYKVVPVYELGEGLTVTSSEPIELIANKLEG